MYLVLFVLFSVFIRFILMIITDYELDQGFPNYLMRRVSVFVSVPKTGALFSVRHNPVPPVHELPVERSLQLANRHRSADQ